MADADGASKFADLARLERALDELNGKKVSPVCCRTVLQYYHKYIISCIAPNYVQIKGNPIIMDFVACLADIQKGREGGS